MSSDYLAPEIDAWVSFHPNRGGFAERGQVLAELAANRWGRRCYRVRCHHEITRGKRQVTETVDDDVSADRLIGLTSPPG